MSYYNGKRDKSKTNKSRFIMRMAKKIRAINILGGKCKCGEDRPWVLQFHHLDPSDKESSYYILGGYALDRIIKEIKKCEVVCERCHREIHASSRVKKSEFNKRLCLDYKNTFSCEQCGYNKCYMALDFHHKSNKSFELADRVTTGKWNTVSDIEEPVKKELDKCEVLCANCHRHEHFDINKFKLYENEIINKSNNLKGNFSIRVNRDKVLELHKNGYSQGDISKELSCGLSTVCEILKSNGIHTHVKMKQIDPLKIIELRKQGLNNPEIARILDCNRYTIPAVLKKWKRKKELESCIL